MSNQLPPALLDEETLARLLRENSPPAWWQTVYEAFRHRIGETFPCTFAFHARYLFCFADSTTADESIARVATALTEFAHGKVAPPPWSVLVVFFQPAPAPMGVETYREQFWNVLQSLHDRDPVDWPSFIPKHPGNPNWTFCFGGQSLFINASTPAHTRRQSRNLGPSLTLVIQHRDGIDSLVPADEQGDVIRSQIRQRIKGYDSIAAARPFTADGLAHDRDWKIYFLSDDNSHTSGPCPLLIRGTDNSI